MRIWLAQTLSPRDPYPECTDNQLAAIREDCARRIRGYHGRYESLARGERRKLRRIDKALLGRGIDVDFRDGSTGE